MREMDLKNSFYISLVVHLILFLFFSLFFLKNPFQRIEKPTVVNIQFDNQLSGSQIKEEVKGAVVEEKKVEEKVMPVKNKEVKKNEVNEKLKEVKEKKEKLEKNIADKPKEKKCSADRE